MLGRGKSMTFKEPLLLSRITTKMITLTEASYPSSLSENHTDRQVVRTQKK